MDLQKLVDSLYAPTSIVSVEKTQDGSYGDIRFAVMNRKYISMVKRRFKVDDDGNTTQEHQEFIPDTPYTDYYPQNRSFEEVCFRAAILKEDIHTYAHIYNIDMWFDIYAHPIEYEEGNRCYCIYTAIANNNADTLIDTLNSSQTSNDVLKTCIKLHKSEDLKETMESVIGEIREICKADGCTVLLLNNEDEDFSILATDYIPRTGIKRVTEFRNFYDIANSWIGMIGDEGDCIIISNQQELDHVSKINYPWYKTLVEAGVKSVVLFPLRLGKELLGFIWAVNFDTQNTMRIKETLELTTYFISSHIARYKVIKRLEKMSYRDVLTGLPNRFACTEYISDLVNRNERFAVVSIDLNNFKSINDTLGFESGNKVLLSVVDRWKKAADKENPGVVRYLTRLGGDEFFLIISEYENEEELNSVISDYAGALATNLKVADYELYVTASFGYAEFPTDADSLDSVISHANAAMNAIKKRNSSEHILRFSSELSGDEHVLDIENMIRTALENDTIFFHLQPQYDIDHSLRGFEALARMKDNNGKMISPGEFIPVAEKVGLIDRIDGTVFRKAALFFGELLHKTDAKLTLSLNASVRHMMKGDFIDEIRGLLKDSGIPAEQLEIEITESIMIDSVDKALNCIDELKSMGIKIAIDDFGTGYSSLSYLNRFPANLLKIDKSFIDKMNAGESSRQYVAAIISIGHVMGFDVISEGVEEQDQLKTLREIGCDYIQGFIWGRPMPSEEAEKLVTMV